MPKIHYLKIDAAQLDALRFGGKTFEIRKNDRNYQVGDWIRFTTQKGKIYLGGANNQPIDYRITHIFKNTDLKPEYCLDIKIGDDVVILSLE